MENLVIKDSETLMERLLNPQMSDHYKTLFFGKYGTRVYEVKVGRKWVFMRSNSHRTRMPLAKFKVHAFLEWRRQAMTMASTEAFIKTDRYLKPKGWWKNYGFESNPKDFVYDKSRLAW